MLNVVCVKRGTAFTPDYVNKLYHMVKRNLTLPHKFICFTEHPKGLDRGIATYNFVDMRLDKWWNKLELFKPHPELEGNRTFFLDLDTVITGNFDEIASYDGDFAILHDMFAARRGPVPKPSQAGRGPWLGSAIMSIAPGFGKFIWEGIQKEIAHIKRYPGDQQYIAKQLVEHNLMPDIWQVMYPGQIHSYKASNLDRTFNEHLNKGMKIVCFHGKPRPHGVAHLDWMREHWR